MDLPSSFKKEEQNWLHRNTGTCGQISYVIHSWHLCWPGPPLSVIQGWISVFKQLCVSWQFFQLSVTLYWEELTLPSNGESFPIDLHCRCAGRDAVAWAVLMPQLTDWWEVTPFSPVNINTSEKPKEGEPSSRSAKVNESTQELALAGWIFSQGNVCNTGTIYVQEQGNWNE